MYLTRVFKSLRCCVLIGEYSTRFFMILGIAATFMSQLLGWSYESTIYYSVLPSSFYSVPCSVHSSVLFPLHSSAFFSVVYSVLYSILFSVHSSILSSLPFPFISLFFPAPCPLQLLSFCCCCNCFCRLLLPSIAANLFVLLLVVVHPGYLQHTYILYRIYKIFF